MARRASGLMKVKEELHSKGLFAPLRSVPAVRELFISEVIGLYRKPG